jgi:hypothetical protein
MLRGAQSVIASLVSFGTISGERPFVPKSASIASEPTKKMIGAGCPGSRSRRIRGQRIGRERHELALPAHLIEPSTLDRVAFVEQEVPLISSMWMRPSCACSTVLAISMMQRAAFSESPKGRLLASFVPG